MNIPLVWTFSFLSLPKEEFNENRFGLKIKKKGTLPLRFPVLPFKGVVSAKVNTRRTGLRR